jgi:hypothetical protein
MDNSNTRPFQLPDDVVALGLELQFPRNCLNAITRGYESQNQDEKWSIYWTSPWVHIWRPDNWGMFCYAVRFEETEKQRIRVVDSWVGREILSSESGLGPDFENHRGIVTWLLEGLADFSGEAFEHRLIAGTRRRNHVDYSGSVANLSEVEEVAATLRSQVSQMLKDDW